MIISLAFLIDLGFLIMNVTIAIMNRGEWLGWLFTALVIWQVATIIAAIKSVYK